MRTRCKTLRILSIIRQLSLLADNNMLSEDVFIPVVVVSIFVALALLAYWYFFHKREPKGSYYAGKGNFIFL